MSITIVTINYNDSEGLRTTIESVLAQEQIEFEYVVVDGGSTDGSVDVIHEYEGRLTRWISEPDRGIFDAMNKGVRLSKGAWINFMNSGDCFASSDSLNRVFSGENSDVDVVYGDYILRYPSAGEAPRRGAPVEDFWKGLNICHQTFFARRELLEKWPFNVDSPVAADFEFANRCVVGGARFAYKDFPIAVITAGGNSDVRRLESLRECREILEDLAREFNKHLPHGLESYYRRRTIREYVRSLLPRKLIDLALRFKSK